MKCLSLGLFLFLSIYILPIQSIESIVWYFQGNNALQTCNVSLSYYNRYPLVPLYYKEINTPYSYNQLNTTSVVNLGYGITCTIIRGQSLLFDKECNNNVNDPITNLFPIGYIMYNPDIRYGNNWLCLGEEPRIARYHASYSTITLYNKNYYVNFYRKVSCSVVCVIGGQQILRNNNNANITIIPTNSVICLSINPIMNQNKATYTMEWIEAESLPYNVVGATAIYSNGTLLVIGGIRDNYDPDTTSSILEADIHPDTCLPYNWRNYGYSSSSRLGNQKLLHNWLPNNDQLENRTFLWTTEGPPSYPQLPGDEIYSQFPSVYIRSYYPSILCGGGVIIPNSLLLTVVTYTIQDIVNLPLNRNTYFIPLQPYNNTNQGLYNYTLEIQSKQEIENALLVAHNPAIKIDLNLPITSNTNLDYIILFDKSMELYRECIYCDNKISRRYQWIYHDGKFMYSMDTVGNTLNVWNPYYSELIIGYDTGDYNSLSKTLVVGSNLLMSFIGNGKTLFVIGYDIFTMAPSIGYTVRCSACISGSTFIGNKCNYGPFEGTCLSCSNCGQEMYLVSKCTREEDTKCVKCTQCIGGTPLTACNATADTQCNPELEALAILPKWKRIPISSLHDMNYIYCFISIFVLWLFGNSVYSIHKMQIVQIDKSILEIINLRLYYRMIFSYLRSTILFVMGSSTIFTYIYFNYSLLSSITAEETNINLIGINNNNYFMGKEIRGYVFHLGIISISFIFLSIIFNLLWLFIQYRSISRIPIMFYLLIPYGSLHHYCMVGLHRNLLTTMVNNNTSHITNKNSISTGIDTSKYRIYILGLLYYSSIICSDGIQLIIILILSDLFSASISSARPVSIGVALCSLINNFFVVYKIISVMCNISVHQVFSKDAEYMNHNLAQFKDTSIITHNPIENTNNSSGLIHHHSKGNRMVTTPKIISDERNHDNLNNTLPTTDSTTINTSPVVMLNEGSTYNLALPISSPINVSKNEMYVTTWSLPHQRNEMETSMFTVSPTPNPTLQISNKSSVHYNTNNTLSYPSLSTLPVAPSSSEERSSHSLDRYFRIQSQLTESKMIMNTNRNSTSITPGYFTYTVDDINSVHTNTSDEQTHSTEQEIIYDMKN